MIRLVQLTCAAILLGIPLTLGCNDAYGCPPALQFNAGHCQQQVQQRFVQPQAYVQQFVQPQAYYAAPQAILLPVRQQNSHHAQQVRLQVQAVKPPRIAFPRAQQRQQIRQQVKQQQVQAVIQVHGY